MRDPEILLPLAPTVGDVAPGCKDMTHMQFTVYYEKGRGILMGAGPIKREDDDCILIPILSGVRVVVEPIARLAPKKLAAAVERLFADVHARRGDAWALVLRVLVKNGLELEATAAETGHAAAAPEAST